MALPTRWLPERERAWRGLLRVAGAGLLALFGADGLGAQTSAQPPLRHGQDLTTRLVGPAAIAVAPATTRPGGEIAEGNVPAFARAVPGSATYDGHEVSGPHLLISGVRIIGPIDISTRAPVVLRGVVVGGTGSLPWLVHTRPGAGPVWILGSEFGAASAASEARIDRGLYLRSDRVVVYRTRIHATADGIQIHGRGVEIVETLVHALATWPGQHNDGIQMLGKSRDVRIVRSRIENPHPQTSAVAIAGPRIAIVDSYLAGGGWTIYGGLRGRDHAEGPSRDVSVTGSVFGRTFFAKSGSFGPVTDWEMHATGSFLWRANRYDDGTPLDLRPPSR